MFENPALLKGIIAKFPQYAIGLIDIYPLAWDRSLLVKYLIKHQYKEERLPV